MPLVPTEFKSREAFRKSISAVSVLPPVINDEPRAKPADTPRHYKPRQPRVTEHIPYPVEVATEPPPDINWPLRPLGIFVARKREFICFTNVPMKAPEVIEAAFAQLPLADNGWDEGRARAVWIEDNAWSVARR